ncbi:MAG: hypothetical protein GC153_10485 [Alphaproteobacteria bacterium]|nr:hypothetical protein [Alphaproteobacteria bacterium]
MRVFWRFIAGLALALAIVLLLGWVFRAPIAGAALTYALKKAGFERPSLAVTTLTASELRVVNVTAGDGALAIDEIDARYSIRDLLSAHKLSSLAVGTGRISATIDDKGVIRIAGARVGGGLGSGGSASAAAISAPFDSASAKEIAIALRAPQGQATGLFSGAFSPNKGGAFRLDAQTDGIASGAWSARNAALSLSVDFEESDAVKAKGSAQGDFETSLGATKGAKLSFDGEARSWREALAKGVGAMTGGARLDIQLTEIPVASSAQLSAALGPLAFGGAPIKTLAASGGLAVALNNGGVRVSAVEDAPLRLTSDRGDAIEVMAENGAPLYESAPPARAFKLAARMSGPLLSGRAQIDATGSVTDDWAFQASGDLDERAGEDLSLGATKFSADGDVSASKADADLQIATTVRAATLGAYRIKNAPVEAMLHIHGDFDAQNVTVATKDNCVTLDRGDFSAKGQNFAVSLNAAKLCGGVAGPLISLKLGDAFQATADGTLTAKGLTYRLGETVIAGAPPRIEFAAAGDAAVTKINGSITDGRLILNKAIIASDSDGSFTFVADKSDFSGEARLSSVKIAQSARPVQIAPIIAAGTARLAKGRIKFDFSAQTPQGDRLGAGAGAHALETGRGDVAFRSGDLNFDPKGLRLVSILPALKGIIDQSTGGFSADARLSWGPKPGDFNSSAEFALKNLSFQGPTRAVTKTAGLDGELKLSSLAPLKTDGPQTLNVKLIDLDALQLENGVAHFDLPGDDALHIIDAAFPWFGGSIGAYDSVISFSGRKATTELRAENVQLAQILDYVNVDGLSGEGVLNGEIPLEFEDGKARIVNGVLSSVGPGVLRYVGKAAESASAVGGADTAFSILRDLRFTSLVVTINGPLDGTIDFKCDFKGTGEVPYGGKSSRLPVRYGINIQANLLDLLSQANLTRDVRLQIERAQREEGAKPND